MLGLFCVHLAGMAAIGEAILQVMAARALENVKPPQDIDMTVTPEGIRYVLLDHVKAFNLRYRISH